MSWIDRRIAGVRRRDCRDTTFVGITGSHGKTTATALLGAMLAKCAPTLTRPGFNFGIAIASTLSRTLPWYHRFCVQELGAFGPNSLDRSIDLLRPDVGIVTAISRDHHQAFRTKEATAAEKAKLVHRLPVTGLAVLNADDPFVTGMAADCRSKVVYFGRSENADLRLLEASSPWPDRLTIRAAYRGDEFTATTRLVGPHWSVSVLASLLAALELGVDRKACLAAIADFEPAFNRMSVHQTPGGVWYVLDAYKAPFFGIESCLGFLDEAQASRRTVVFGTISDYPGDTSRRYRRAARMALSRADRVVFTGRNALHARLADVELKDRQLLFEDPVDVSELLARDSIPGEVVYVKASEVDRLERILVRQLDRKGCRTGINCREFLRKKHRAFLADSAAATE